MKKVGFFGLCLAVAGLFFIKATCGADLLVSGEFTNNGLNVVVSAPGGFTNRVEIYACSNLLSGTWRVATENLHPVDGSPAQWHTEAGSSGFFVAGNMDVDSDFDGVPDAREQFVHKTSSDKWDSDGDWMPDGWEMTHFLNALTSDGSADADGDGLSNQDEYQRGADPHNSDTDGDGLSDGVEVLAGTDPLLTDTDGDGLPDGWEVRFGYDPVNTAGALSGADQIGQFDTIGSALAVEVRGDVAYVADGTNGLVILDVRHPGGRELGSLSLEGEANDLLLTNNTLWMALGANGVAAVDVSDPFRPCKLGSYYTDGWTGGLALQSNLLYVANTAKDLLILDVQHLDDIVQIGLYNDYYSGGYGVCVKGTNAWLALKDRLVRLNISNPSNPVYIHDAGLYSFPHDLQITSNRLYVTTDGYLGIWNQNLTEIQKFYTAGIAYGFGMESNRVLVAEGANFAELIDISNETVPALITNVVVSGFVNGAALRGERGYLAAGEGGLIAIRFATDTDGDGMDDNREIRYFDNLSQTATNDFDSDGLLNREEFMIGTSPANTDSDADGLSDHNEVWIYGSDPVRADGDLDGLSDYAEVNTYCTNPAEADTDGDGMPDGWEIANGFNPLIADGAGDADSDGLSNADEYLTHTDPHNADSDGDSLSDGWEAFHGTSNLHTNYPLRASFEQIAVRDTPGEARNVFVNDGWLYTADGTNGLVIFDLSIPSAPVLTATLDTGGFACDVVVSNRYAYIADGVNGLVIVAVSNPASPVVIGYTNTSGNAQGVAVRSNYVYLADGTNNLMTFDVSNKVLPKVTADAWYTENMHDVFVQGSSVYAALFQNVRRFSLTKPAVPELKDSATGLTGRDMIGIHGNASLIVAVAGTNGVWVMSATNLNWWTAGSRYDTGGNASGVFVSSNYAYIADGPGGLTVLDISTPTAPVEKYQQDTAGMAYGVYPNGEYVYAADGTNGVAVFRLVEDNDGDGMSDFWERAYFGSLAQAAAGDFDGDGINNRAEYMIAGNPCTNDADGDLLSDYAEIWTYHTQPLSRDTDFDGRDDRAEIFALGGAATDPLISDCDHDELLDGAEITAGADPHLADTDGDGMPDGWEVANGLSPAIANASSDFDGDGLGNLAEYQRGSKANVPDTDNDGLNDGAEVAAGTGLLSVDSDGDSLSDGVEVHTYGTNPLNVDSDNDGMSDGWEVTNGLSPTTADASADKDGDGLNNLAEYQNGAKANVTDSDGDGLNDYYEVTHNLNPANSDSDGDGLSDKNDKTPGSFEMLIPCVQSNALPFYINGFPDGTGYPVFATNLLFNPGLVNCVSVTNVVAWGTVDDAFEINGYRYEWSLGIQQFSNNITAAVTNTPAGRTNGIFEIKLYDYIDLGASPNHVALSGACLTSYLRGELVDLIPDWDRNGVIDTNDLNRARTGEPFRFWANDDDDSGYDGGQDIPGAGVPDWKYGNVDGVRDLIDFFPVQIAISNALNFTSTTNAYRWYLCHDEGALNAVQTTLTTNTAGNYLRNVSTASGMANAVAVQLTPAPYGWRLPDAFLNDIRDNGKGIVLIEARAKTTKPLRLELRKLKPNGSEELIDKRELPLSITGVEEMFRHKNLRDDLGGIGAEADRLGSPTNWPDTVCNNKYVVMLHGFAVDGQQARGWHSETFKRLWWAESNAKFVGVSWYGDQSNGFVPGKISYHHNVQNAFKTAPLLKNYLDTLGGEKIVIAHSLGNMVVSAAIEDYSASVNKYFMLNAAVASECYDPVSYDSVNMVHPDWDAYTSRLQCAEWYKLFSTPDKRAELTWRGRFANVVSNAYNFYSPGEDVLNVRDAYPSLVTWDELLHWDLSPFAWWKQELLKGRNHLLPVVGSLYGGWGFNDAYDGYSPAQAAGISTNTLRTEPFFDPGRDKLGPMLYTDYGGSAFAQTFYDQLLAEMIPAISDPAGLIALPQLNGPPLRNFDMQTLENGWPAGRGNSEWHHSDFKEIAYPYVYQLFDTFETQGGLGQ